MSWSLPVVDVATGNTTHGALGQLERADAVAWCRGGDDRPLLVLRDCSCSGGYGGLIEDDLAPVELRILAQWFHCVRLPAAARRPEHPAHALFEEGSWHVLIDNAAGELVPVASRPGELLRRMRKSLRRVYVTTGAQGWRARVPKLEAQLKSMDQMDDQRTQIRAELIREREGRGDSARAVTLAGRLDKLDAARDAMHAEREQLLEVERR